jgi:hypothetical protein
VPARNTTKRDRIAGNTSGRGAGRSAEIVEVHDLGDVTIATLRLQGHGAESDTPLDVTAWQITQFRHGKGASAGAST